MIINLPTEESCNIQYLILVVLAAGGIVWYFFWNLLRDLNS